MEMVKRESFWFDEETILKISTHYNAKYLGSLAIKLDGTNWTEEPVEVFYQLNPDHSKGHSHYIGIFPRYIDGQIMICRAESAFSEPIIGILEDGLVYVSRYRHDYTSTPGGSAIDGGRDYLRTTALSKGSSFVEVRNVDGEFIFTHRN